VRTIALVVESRDEPRVLRRVLGLSCLGLIGAEAITIGALQLASLLRKARRDPPGPRTQAAPVQLGADRLQLHTTGEALYQEMLAAIDGAQESVFLETFTWKPDAWGQRFKDSLANKARSGVDVYVTYDHFGNLVVPAWFKEFPPEVHVLAYRGITRPWHALDPRRYALDHRKLLIVDGCIGFIGGYNLGSLYAEHWSDTHLRVDGPTAAELADAFSSFWDSHSPPESHIGRRYRRRFNPILHLESTNALKLTFPIRDMYVDAIDRAEHHICLSNAYFVPDRTLVGALTAAARRGVQVRLLVPWVSNHVIVDWLSRTYFTELLAAGVRVYRYRSMLHAKTCTVDGVWTTIGTANLDRLSAVGNYEINLEIYSDELAGEMEHIFEADLRWAEEVDQQGWNARPWLAKIGEIAVAPLRTLL